MTRAILCFGDSNTWGSDPSDPDRRFPADVRWPGVLRAELGEGFEVYEEGLGGRTTAFDMLPSPYRSGRDMLAPILETHAPLDVVIILLGTNDISMPQLTVDDIAKGVAELIGIVHRSVECGPDYGPLPPDVLLVAPPVVGPLTAEDLPFYGGAVERSRQLGPAYAQVAEALGCAFLDLAPVVTTSPLDGWHWDAAEHTKAGAAIAAAVRALPN